MGHWIKKFADGKEIIGTDTNVARKLASWSKTPLNGMIGTVLQHGDYILNITGSGEYWQSDNYEAIFPGPKATLVKRRIERKINSTDTHFSYSIGPGLAQVIFNSDIGSGGQIRTVNPAWVGKWLIVEYNIREQKGCYYITDTKI